MSLAAEIQGILDQSRDPTKATIALIDLYDRLASRGQAAEWVERMASRVAFDNAVFTARASLREADNGELPSPVQDPA